MLVPRREYAEPKQPQGSGVAQPFAVGTDEALAQVERILGSAACKGSRRCGLFLRHVASRTLQGRLETLKERLIGAEVFGRDVGYDTSEDPVVRTTAGELRKRLAQYYQEPGHERELRVELPAGTYAPHFHWPALPAPVVLPLEPPVARPVSRPRLRLAIVPVLLLAVAAVTAWTMWPVSALDRFWGPVVHTPGPVLICIGTPAALSFSVARDPEMTEHLAQDPQWISKHPGDSLHMRDLAFRPNRYVAFLDSVALARVASLLTGKGKPYHVRGGGTTTYTDLRDEASVLMGAFTNDWTVKLSDKMRFYFAKDARSGVEGIYDHQNPQDRKWTLVRPWPDWQVVEDYALVWRVHMPDTDRFQVMAAGITQYGTYAAGEFITSEEYLQEALRQAPANWGKQNMQVVLATSIVENNPGRPRIVAIHFW